MLLHGAAAADERGALLIVAESGRGKSTAAAAALRAGWRLLSDDLTLVLLRHKGPGAVAPMSP